MLGNLAVTTTSVSTNRRNMQIHSTRASQRDNRNSQNGAWNKIDPYRPIELGLRLIVKQHLVTAVPRHLLSVGLGNLLCLGNRPASAPVTAGHSLVPSLRPSRALGNRGITYTPSRSTAVRCGALGNGGTTYALGGVACRCSGRRRSATDGAATGAMARAIGRCAGDRGLANGVALRMTRLVVWRDG